MTTHKLESNHPTAKQPALVSTGEGANLFIQKNHSAVKGHLNEFSYEQTIKEFVPASWFHPVGIYKVLARIWDRLPDMGGKLFLTFTLDPKLYASEEVVKVKPRHLGMIAHQLERFLKTSRA
jgi:hypothetical protein